MSKTSVLIFSIASLIVSAVFTLLPRKALTNAAVGMPTTPLIVLSFIIFLLGALMVILWIVVIYVVFTDAKKRNRSTGYAGLALLLGGIGGLIYYFTIMHESNQATAQTPLVTMSQTSRNNLRMFSIIMAIILGLATLMTLPWKSYQTFNIGLTATLGFVLLLCILMVIFSYRR